MFFRGDRGPPAVSGGTSMRRVFAIHSLVRRHARLAPTLRHTRGTTIQYQWCLWYLQNFGNKNNLRNTSKRSMDKDHALEEMMGKLGECESNLFGTYGNNPVAFYLHVLIARMRWIIDRI